MAPTPLLLVSNDGRLAEDIQGRLRRALGRAAPRCGFDSVHDDLGPGAERLLLLAAASMADCEEVARLVQEIHLRQWPATVLIAQEGGAGDCHDLASLDPYVAGRFAWPGDEPRLLESVRYYFRVAAERPAREVPEEEILDQLRRELVRYTPSLMPLAERLALAAAHEVTVLLTGETGTGKTHLARLIHEHSPRRQHRLTVIPCGALAASLIESELFGHARGAFTGADRPKAGKFEAAGEGTLLLDEVDTLGLEQQAKLLRVIETGEYEPVGSNDTKVCRARIIAASNWDLEEAVAQGKFRQDLYYRLNVLAFYLPPLRERPQDIGPLARGMVARFSRKFRKNLFAVAPAAVAALEAFPWPGNIRQLENVIQQAVLVSTGDELLLQHLPQPVREFTPSPAAGSPAPAPAGSLAERREQQERLTIERALEEASHCRSRAAGALGISRVTLYNKMKKYGLADRPRPWLAAPRARTG